MNPYSAKFCSVIEALLQMSILTKNHHAKSVVIRFYLFTFYSSQRAEAIERAGRVRVNSCFAPFTTTSCGCSAWFTA